MHAVIFTERHQEMEKDVSKVAGGLARSAALSPERKKEIAKKAARSRWDGDLPKASHEGEFPLGASNVACAVLPNGLRVITQATFLRALGRSRSPKAGTGVLSTVDELPFFLAADALKPFISEDLAMSTTPVFYASKSGAKGVGYDARLLPQVAEVYLKFRDSCLSGGKKIPTNYEHIVRASDVLVRGLANVGIIALVDEATGFQEARAKDALSKILEEFIAKELQPYVTTFPPEYYEELFRLRGLEWTKHTVKKPQYFGTLTNDIIYKRLAPGVLEELKKVTPKRSNGTNKAKLFQSLTANKGYVKLVSHLGKVIAFMQVTDDYKSFLKVLDAKLPRQTQQIEIEFEYSAEADGGKGI